MIYSHYSHTSRTRKSPLLNGPFEHTWGGPLVRGSGRPEAVYLMWYAERHNKCTCLWLRLRYLTRKVCVEGSRNYELSGGKIGVKVQI
jgi:hypothetical protein